MTPLPQALESALPGVSYIHSFGPHETCHTKGQKDLWKNEEHRSDEAWFVHCHLALYQAVATGPHLGWFQRLCSWL